MAGNPKKNAKQVPFKSILKLEAKQASIYTLSSFVIQFGSFLVVPLFWQKLSPADYGTIAITEMIGSFLNMFLGLNLDSSITRFYYEWPQEQRKYRVGTIWTVGWMSCMILGITSTFVLLFVSQFLFPEVAFYPFIFLGLIATILRSFGNIPYATMRIANSPVLYSIYSLVSFVIGISLSIYLVLILEKGLYGYFIANIIGSGVMVIMGAVVMLKFAVPCVQKSGLQEALKFSIPLTPTSFVAGVTNILDRFLLQQFASLETLGIYAVSLKFTNLVLYLHNALKMSYVPFMIKVVSKDRERGVQQIAQMRMFYLLPLLVFAMAISAYISDFVHFVNRADYYPIVELVPWLIGPPLLSSLTIYFAQGLFLSKRTELTWIPSAIRLVVILISGVLLIPRFQIGGVVISRYVSTIAFLAIYFFLSERYYPIPVNWMKSFFLLLLIVFGIGLSSWFEFNNLIISIVLKGFFIMVVSLLCLIVIVGFPQTYRVLTNYIFRRSSI